MNRLRVVALLLFPILGSCDGDVCGGPSSSPDPVPLVSGGYALHSIRTPTDRFRFGSKEVLDLAVDREAGTVTLRYEEEGSTIREVWRITSSEFGR